MNILNLALSDLILEAPTVDPVRAYNEIRNAVLHSPVGVDEKEYPTHVWLGGITQNRGSSFGKITALIKKLNYMEAQGQDTPEFEEYAASKEYRDAFRFRIAMNKLLQFDYIMREENGRYVWPSTSDKVRLDRLSKLRTYLTRDFHEVKNLKDQSVQNREAKYAAEQDAINGVKPEYQEGARLYSKLTLSAFNLLANLNKKRGPKDVANFRDTVNRLSYSESADLALLRELGFLNEKNLLNRGAVSKLAQFLQNTPETQKFAINADINKPNQKAQHNRQLAINAAGKPAINQPEETEAELGQEDSNPEFADDMEAGMTDEERRAKYSRIRDIEAGTKNSSKNARAAGYKHTFSDLFKNALN